MGFGAVFDMKAAYFAIGAVCAIALTACGGEKVDTARYEPRTFDIPTTVVTIEDIPQFYETPGSVVSDDRIVMASRLAAFVQRVPVSEGQPVDRGELLFQLEGADVESSIEQASAALGQARVVYDETLANLERYERLVASESVAEAELRGMRLKRDVAKEQMAQAKAALEVAREQRRYTTVASPVDGVVIDRHKRAGDLATPGAPIVTIEARQSLVFQTHVAESRVQDISVGDRVDLRIDALARGNFEGTVLRIIPSGDPVTRQFEVKVSLPQDTSALPGMFGRASFLLGAVKSPVAPREALVERGGLTGVFVVDKENRARFRAVRIGGDYGDGVEIVAGLKGGESILQYFEPALREGDYINTDQGADDRDKRP